MEVSFDNHFDKQSLIPDESLDVYIIYQLQTKCHHKRHRTKVKFIAYDESGILKSRNKGLLLSDEYDQDTIQGSLFLTKIDMEVSSVNHFGKQSLIPDESLDFIFTKSFQCAPEFIDGSLKVGGIITVQQPGEWCPRILSTSHLITRLFITGNYSRQMFFVLKKLENVGRTIWGTKRRLFRYNTPEEKEAALTKLEDVLLEPPRASSRELKRHHK
ncbi:hypothetical protein GQ457_01G018260 [Hibiscus cannabinus]